MASHAVAVVLPQEDMWMAEEYVIGDGLELDEAAAEALLLATVSTSEATLPTTFACMVMVIVMVVVSDFYIMLIKNYYLRYM